MTVPSRVGPPDDPDRGRPGPSASWLQWVRAQPVLAGAVVLFCLGAIVGLVLSLPRDMGSPDRGDRVADEVEEAPADAPAPAPADTSPPSPAPAVPETPASGTVARRPWAVQPASAPSPRGLALVYAYRALPPGGESRYEWFVRLSGPRSLLEGVDRVTWQMDPPPKDGGELVSRDRANDGFPLLGDGPGGWFGVSAVIRYKDGREERLSRRVELPD